MPSVNDMFPSKYISAADLKGRHITVKMSSVIMEEVRGDHGMQDKYVLYFEGAEKGLILNVTNANSIAEMYGTETENWVGNSIEIFPTRVQFGSKMVDAIRINAPRGNGATQPAQSYKGNPNLPPSKQAEAMADSGTGQDGYGAAASPLDDEIPF